MSDNIPTQFSDEQARAILVRAIEIDARAPLTTTEELRVLAAEIGVSTTALEAALREQGTSRKEQGIAAARRTAIWIAGLGVSLGATAGWLLVSGELLAATTLMTVSFIASTGFVIYRSATGSLRAFHLRNLALWGGAAAGSVASMVLLGDGVDRMPALTMTAWCLNSWIASGVLGSAAVLGVRRSRNADGGDPDSRLGEAPVASSGNRWARIVKRILGTTIPPLRLAGQPVPFAEP